MVKCGRREAVSIKDIDITKIELSSVELKKLREIQKAGVIDKDNFGTDSILTTLESRGLIELTYSDLFPHRNVPGMLVPLENAIQLSDAGQQLLTLSARQRTDVIFTRAVAIWGGVTGTLAIVLEIWLHFL